MHKFIPIMFAFMLCACLAGNTKQTIPSIELEAKLAQLVARDQVVRKELCQCVRNGKLPNDLEAYLKYVDQENFRELKKIVIGNDLHALDEVSINNLWLLSQHADREPKFQKKMLRFFKKIGSKEFGCRKYYAYLYDRVQINRNGLQRYGTQGECIAHHKWQAFPIENQTALNRLRARVGLNRFVTYQAEMNKFCN